MKKYSFTFFGRQSGAIGIFYKIKDTYNVQSLSEAKSLLYEDYEHIQMVERKCNNTHITKDEFDAAPWTNVRSNLERPRKKDGSYLYTRSDSEITK